MRAVGALIVSLLASGCYGPTVQVGLPCSPEGECPEGQMCADDGTCQLPGGGGDGDGGTSGGDATPPDPDAMPIPLESWLTSYELPALERAADVAEVGGGFALVGNNGTVIAIDPRGQIRWQRRLEGVGFLSGVARVTGGMVVVGSSGSGAAAVMLDHDGDVQWQKTFLDQTSSFADTVVPLPGGDVMVVANSDDASDVPSPWLVRMNPKGEIVEQKRYTLAGGLRVSGGTSAGENGGFVATGVNEYETDLEERDMIVFKVDSAGAVSWAKRISGGDNEWGTTASEDFVDGHIAVVGGTWSDSFGAADMWIVRLDPNGALQSQHRIGTSSQDNGLRVRPLGPDGAILVGESSAGGNTDFVVVEIKNNALTTQFALDADVSLYADGAALTDEGLVLFGDTDAFGPDIGFFAAGVLAPATLSGCAHTSTPDTDIATSTATSSNITLTVTTTTATAADIDGEVTTPGLSPVFECQ
ncbi:MAG TPA: hypothetical protein VMZ28_22855 [Kofleriaceae bacterium]|nr:hypothetical protein [Kofleriaceae bacterium]